jgi:molecular chaperone DnaK
MTHDEIILGIDLGTTFSSAAAWVSNSVQLVRDTDGDARIPSVVHFSEDGEVIVGSRADDLRALDPENTVSGIKRILGRQYDSPEARVLGAHTAFRTTQAPNGQVIANIRGRQLPACEIASMIIGHLRDLAEKQFRRRITQAVIALPASATPEVESATRLAARMAGVQVVATIPEPCAGAMAYHIHDFHGKRRVLVYDFGGGTFDVSVLTQRNGDFTVDSVGGDDALGGDDFDSAMANLVCSHVWQNNEIDITGDAVRMDTVRRTCERAKRALSISPVAPIRIPDAFSFGGLSHDIDLVVQRAEMETRWRNYVDRSLKITARTMVQAGLRPRNVDLVLLVGGTTATPLVHRTVERVLKRKAHQGPDPQTAVAIGAGLLGAGRVQLAMAG